MKMKRNKAKKVESPAKGTNPTWISRPSWVVKTVMPLPGDNQVIILHAFVRLRKALY